MCRLCRLRGLRGLRRPGRLCRLYRVRGMRRMHCVPCFVRVHCVYLRCVQLWRGSWVVASYVLVQCGCVAVRYGIGVLPLQRVPNAVRVQGVSKLREVLGMR